MTTPHPPRRTTITLIAAVARNRVIGMEGGLPWRRLPGDLPRFKALTMGHVVVMGRKTFDSIGQALPGRSTVVVTRQRDWSAEGVRVVASVPEALKVAASIDNDVFVIGGSEIYAHTLGDADRLELTEVDAEPPGDAFFPEVDWSAWREVTRERRDGFDWVTYIRR